jgi:hypothetical protein
MSTPPTSPHYMLSALVVLINRNKHLADLAADQPLWDAYRHGDRDPNVAAGYRRYAEHRTHMYKQGVI